MLIHIARLRSRLQKSIHWLHSLLKLHHKSFLSFFFYPFTSFGHLFNLHHRQQWFLFLLPFVASTFKCPWKIKLLRVFFPLPVIRKFYLLLHSNHHHHHHLSLLSSTFVIVSRWKIQKQFSYRHASFATTVRDVNIFVSDITWQSDGMKNNWMFMS